MCLPYLPGSCKADYVDPRYQYMRYTNYPLPGTTKTPMGIPIGPGVDAQRIDDLTRLTVACMGVDFQPCGVYAVMIAPDWSEYPMSAYGGTQAFPCANTPPENLCSGVNQWPATIIITPDLHAYRWELVRLLTRDTPTRCY